ncbi:hypothetical protein [Streptomyces mirabilis]
MVDARYGIHAAAAVRTAVHGPGTSAPPHSSGRAGVRLLQPTH